MIHDHAIKHDEKIIFLILDGACSIPSPQFSCRTPLKAAQKLIIDKFATERGVLD